MKKFNVKVVSLALLIVASEILNSAWAMENAQRPIYEILAEKKVDWLIEQQKISEKDFQKQQDQFDDALKEMGFYDPEKEKVPSVRSGHMEIDKIEAYSAYVKEYREFENYLKKIKTSPEKLSIGSNLFSGITYAMTLEEMKQKIKEAFNKMKMHGLIISKKEFKKIKHEYYLYNEKSPARQDLNRVGGIEYLKKKINESQGELHEKFRVPDYIIVLDDADKISVNIEFGSHESFPEAAWSNNGKIYYKKIKGAEVAREHDLYFWNFAYLRGIGFVDFNGPGNIIKQEDTGLFYIIDTEKKSFDLLGTGGEHFANAAFEYAADRFRHLNPGVGTKLTYEFDLK